jgi:NitT/TauT family transport system substrate-binding protein
VAALEPPPETTTVRIQKPALCVSSLYFAEELLRAEGFTDIRYVDAPEAGAIGSVHGEVDFSPAYASQCVRAIDAGEPLTLLAGVMVGCFELFAREGIASVAELKGNSIGVGAAGSLSQQLLTLITAQVGLDAGQDVQWVTDPSVKPIELFVQGKIDAFLAFPPEPQDLRARHTGHVIVNTAVDRPWSQYFCCMLAGNREFVAMHPVATKRVMRAILKATDLCATEPARAAQRLADRGLTARYDLYPPDAERKRLQMARIRRRGHYPVLCFALARRRPDQIDSAKDHRGGYRLALLQRAQARAEGMNATHEACR